MPTSDIIEKSIAQNHGLSVMRNGSRWAFIELFHEDSQDIQCDEILIAPADQAVPGQRACTSRPA